VEHPGGGDKETAATTSRSQRETERGRCGPTMVRGDQRGPTGVGQHRRGQPRGLAAQWATDGREDIDSTLRSAISPRCCQSLHRDVFAQLAQQAGPVRHRPRDEQGGRCRSELRSRGIAPGSALLC
jgi:hypothetical protein